MKKMIKCFGIFLVTALLSFSLFACGSSEKYNFSKTTIEGNSIMASTMSSFVSVYDALYKDAYIEVSDKDITMVLKDNKGKMSYTKDGDKYVLAGEYTETLKESFAELNSLGVNVEIDIYGEKTSDGFKIVIAENVVGQEVSFVLNFTKA